MTRVLFLRLALPLAATCAVLSPRPLSAQSLKRASTARPTAARFSVVEASIADMRAALEQKRTTSREIVIESLTRIALYEDRLHAVITVNPKALAIADSLDRLRAQGKIIGPLHGIPVALKDNIHTIDMPTTGGLNGYGMNPWDPRRDPRDVNFDGRPVLTTGGSSSGAGTNVSFWVANVGTETSGSILSPSNQNMLAGIKPTVGRVSRYGVIPITADQDTPGPMARSVSDAAIMLGALEGANPDPNDAATNKCPPPEARDYTKFLNVNGLKGARIGIPRAFFYDRSGPPAPGGTIPRGGLNDAQKKIMDEAIAVLKQQGATVVDPADIPSVTDTSASSNFLNWSPCSGDQSKGRDADCSVAFKYGMKRDFNTWLKSLGDRAPVKTLTELRQWNIAHQRAGAIKYGQANLDISDEMDVQTDRARYEADRRKDILLSATNGVDAALKASRLDALLFPGVSSANIGARPGYPTVTVPYGFVPVPPGTGATAFPPGFEPKPSPFNVSFTASACSEPKLIELAFAFEQATKKRFAPPLFP